MGHEEKLLDAGFAEAEDITGQFAKTFYFASRLLPQDKKRASYAIYAICRISDEIADRDSSASREEELDELQQKIDTAYDDTGLGNGLLLAFRSAVKTYRIPKKYFDELISGMRLDLKKTRYENFDELYEYCYKVAGVVGLIMLKVFGYQDSRAEKYAADLGIAMQLTNILRDIKEDYGRGRIYLPQDEMLKCGVGETDIADSRISENFKSLIKSQIARAKKYYCGSEKGIELINNRNSRVVAKAMEDMYSRILDAIENNGYDIFSKRAHIGTFGKSVIALKTLLTQK